MKKLKLDDLVYGNCFVLGEIRIKIDTLFENKLGFYYKGRVLNDIEDHPEYEQGDEYSLDLVLFPQDDGSYDLHYTEDISVDLNAGLHQLTISTLYSSKDKALYYHRRIKKYAILDLEYPVSGVDYLTVEEILEKVNCDRSEDWTDYTEEDWEEGMIEFTQLRIVLMENRKEK